MNDNISSALVSVIIPVYNDPNGIRKTIESVVNQTYPKERYEILPVNNDSTDETGTVITELSEQYPDFIIPLEELSVQGSYAARNRGIKESNGEILVFIDSDMFVSEQWIEKIVDSFNTHECDYLGYNVEISTSDAPSLYERYEQALSFPVKSYLEDSNYVPTCALSVRKSLIDSVGRFDNSLVSGGDKEFGRRVANSRHIQCYDDSITVFHPARDTFASLATKAKRIGRGHEQFRQNHSELSKVAHPFHPTKFVPPSPWRLRRRFSSNTKLSYTDLLLFYLLSYLLKIYQGWGALYEYYKREI